ncbi:MAG: FTR1 family protein [Haliea sp.]|nr:FTR1 family protein [Haliea sp.]MDP5063346.1 FTR1 family protein [Haliea sp.]
MFLNSVVIVLREVLEAAVLVSALLALARNARLGNGWLWMALPIATCLVLLYAYLLAVITDAMDGAGQEVINASLQVGVYLLLLPILVAGCSPVGSQRRRMLSALMTVAVTFAIVRECAEVHIYVRAFAALQEHASAVWAGSALGIGIGVSAGVLVYAALRALPARWSQQGCQAMLALIGAGMVMQATMLLEQVDWLPDQAPVWDSSPWLSEQSFMGELLYAVLGYEATPGVLQVTLYLGSLLVAAGALWWGWKERVKHALPE